MWRPYFTGTLHTALLWGTHAQTHHFTFLKYSPYFNGKFYLSHFPSTRMKKRKRQNTKFIWWQGIISDMCFFVWLRRSHAPVAKVHIGHVVVKWHLVAAGGKDETIPDSVRHLSKACCSPHATEEQDGCQAKGHTLLLSNFTIIWRDLGFQFMLQLARQAGPTGALPSWTCGDSSWWREWECLHQSEWDGSGGRGWGWG